MYVSLCEKSRPKALPICKWALFVDFIHHAHVNIYYANEILFILYLYILLFYVHIFKKKKKYSQIWYIFAVHKCIRWIGIIHILEFFHILQEWNMFLFFFHHINLWNRNYVDFALLIANYFNHPIVFVHRLNGAIIFYLLLLMQIPINFSLSCFFSLIIFLPLQIDIFHFRKMW